MYPASVISSSATIGGSSVLETCPYECFKCRPQHNSIVRSVGQRERQGKVPRAARPHAAIHFKRSNAGSTSCLSCGRGVKIGLGPS